MLFWKFGIFDLLVFISVLARANTLLNCLKEVDPTQLPICKIIDHAIYDGISSYECLAKWENSIFLHKDSNLTLDCSAPFPIDMNYEGVKPIKNFHLDFYKEVTEPMTFGVRVHIVAKNLEYSGDYMFHPLGKNESKVTVYVFAEKKDLPQFLDLKDGKPVLDAYIDPSEPDAIVIPCRSANYNALILGVYYDYEDLKDQIDGVKLRYDPRRGFIRKIPTDSSEDSIYGLYECYTEWKTSGRDRKKIYAKAPPSEDGDDGENEEEEVIPVTSTETQKPVTYVTDLISFHSIPDNHFRAECTLPTDLTKFHPTFFGNAAMDNPVASRFNIKCSHLDSNCGEHVRLLGNMTKHPNFLELRATHAQGLIQCAAGQNTEILEYFTGADDHIYYDWNLALENQALVKVVPAQNYERYTIGGTFTFKCHFAKYLAVFPVWWAISYENGTILEEYETSTMKTYTLNLDASKIHCGVTLWNSSIWYKSSVDVKVIDFVLPVLREQNRRMSFKSNVPNQVLRCDVDPGPDIKLEWLREGKKVDNIPTLDMGDSLVLFFQQMNSTHEGNYTCRASSKSTFVDAEYQIILDEVLEKDQEERMEGEISDESENTTCKGIGKVSLHHQGGNESEVESTEDISEDEVFILKLSPQGNCANQSSGSENSSLPLETQILVKVFNPNAEVKAEVEVKPGLSPQESGGIPYEEESEAGTAPELSPLSPQNTDDLVVVGGGHSPETLGSSSESRYSDSDDGKTEENKMAKKNAGKTSENGRRQRLFHYLMPILTGLTIVLVVLIIAYTTYSYFVSPWKVRRISTISTGPII